jgi:hypothetical protein
MIIKSVNTNVLFCNESVPDLNQHRCVFQFRSRDHQGLFSRKLLNEYIRAQYNSLRMSEYQNTYSTMVKTHPVKNAASFKSEPYNYYFQLNDGSFEITYDDETVQTVSNSYTSCEWTDYKNLWTYEKDCIIELKDKAYFLWLSLVDVEPEQVNVKVLRLKRESGVCSPSYQTTLSGENMIFVCGQNFEFNGQRYDEYNSDFKSHIQSFSNVTSLSFSTDSCASLVLVEKK